MKETVSLKKLDPRAQIPTYGTPLSAGADLYLVADEPVSLAPNETKLLKTGIAVSIPEGYVGLVFARSGLASKRGLAPANKVGVIDADYRGEIMVALHNHGTETQVLECGERIAQMAILPFLSASFVEVADLDETERGNGGFGSTGRK